MIYKLDTRPALDPPRLLSPVPLLSSVYHIKMASKAIKVDYNGRVAVITLNQPERLNSFNEEQFYLLGECLREIAKHDEVAVTLLIGTGRFFSSYVIIIIYILLSGI